MQEGGQGMAINLIVIILGVAAWLGLMGMALALPIYPGTVRITRWLVCPPGTEMRVGTFVASYHRPGQRGITIECVGADGITRDVKVKALLALWALFFGVSLPAAAVIVLLAYRWLA
jgi:hypothetical protein